MNTVESFKIPPHSLQAEQSVIGALLLDNLAFDRIVDKVLGSDFYHKDHRLIFQAIAHLSNKQDPIDVITVSDLLERSGVKHVVGWLSYVGTIANDTPSAANIEAYAKIVRDYSILRQLIGAANDISSSAFSATESPEIILAKSEQAILAIGNQFSKGEGLKPIKSFLASAVDKIEELFERGGDISGLATGFAALDNKTAGLQDGDLVILAGRPSMGKTALAMNIAENIAIKSDGAVAVFSMEMPGDSLAMRMMSSLGRIDQLKVRTGKLDDDEWPRLTSAINILAEKKLFIDDGAALTVNEVGARARRLAKEHGKLALIVIDYLQLMSSPASGDNRVQQLSDISRGLKALAKELHCPILSLSQLNRNLESRQNKRPIMSDLRESGALEQDSDLIIFVYRDEVYNEDSQDKGTAELIIAKQRNGPLGTVRLTFLGEFTRFENFAGYNHDAD